MPLLELLSRSGTPAVATDMDGQVLWWNREAENLIGGNGNQAPSRPCYDAIGGLDGFGNRFCHENCSVVAMSRSGEAVRGFEMVLGSSGPRPHPVGRWKRF